MDAETYRAVRQTSTDQTSNVSLFHFIYLHYLIDALSLSASHSQNVPVYAASRGTMTASIWREWDVRSVQRYELLEIVGKGSYGEVARAKER